MLRLRSFLPALAGLAILPTAAAAQDINILHPVSEIERRLRGEPFEILASRGSRFEGDRTQNVALAFPDSLIMAVKWAKAPPGAQKFNNEPRYELAAYELQKLFLEEPEFVVPPTVARAFPLSWYQTIQPSALPTFRSTSSVLVVLQYWLTAVTGEGVFDRLRLQSDTAYARNFGNLNILTYLIRHNDANAGNVLISSDSARPRLFTVDNGVAFGSQESDRGHVWRSLRTDRLPRATVERLRRITREDLDRALGVVAQFEVRDGELVPVPPSEPLSWKSGVRDRDGVVQLGLSATDVAAVHRRLQFLLKQIDDGRIQTF